MALPESARPVEQPVKQTWRTDQRHDPGRPQHYGNPAFPGPLSLISPGCDVGDQVSTASDEGSCWAERCDPCLTCSRGGLAQQRAGASPEKAGLTTNA